jgi:hypothetical protein
MAAFTTIQQGHLVQWTCAVPSQPILYQVMRKSFLEAFWAVLEAAGATSIAAPQTEKPGRYPSWEFRSSRHQLIQRL